MEDNKEYLLTKDINKASLMSILAFIGVFLFPVLSMIIDIIVLNEELKAFIGALIIGCYIFLLAVVLFIASIILLFGIYIAKSNGFWPWKVTKQFLKEVVDEITLDKWQVNAVVISKYIIAALIFSCIVMAIIASKRRKHFIENGVTEGLTKIKVFSRLARLFGILNFFTILLSALIIKSV